MNPQIGEALADESGLAAFEFMHQELDKVWSECFRVVSDGGFVCINIGDATRTVRGDFRLYHNHARIVSGMVACGFDVLPDILWRKPTNAPTKFMGSGMLPAGAYVTMNMNTFWCSEKGASGRFCDNPIVSTDVEVHFFGKREICGFRMFGKTSRVSSNNSSHQQAENAVRLIHLNWPIG